MSNALAIAAVTETLVKLIGNNLGPSGLAAPSVTALAPDGPGPLPNPGVNVFLYQVTPNTAYRNADLPTRTADGSLLRKPQVALDLHYLLTFYGNDGELEQQRLLGATALALHANPTLPRSLVQTVQAQASNAYLSTSTLDAQAELVRITPIVFSLEELSKLWSFLLKIDYVLSTAYVASVVLIEADDPVPPPALPVRRFTVKAPAIDTPLITAVVASPDPSAPIIDGAVITVEGAHLTSPGDPAEVVVTGTPLTPSAVSADALTVTLTPGAFAPGVQTVQVRQPILLGSPPVIHPGTGAVSGIFAFVLAPTIGPGSVTISGGNLVVPVVPQVQIGQRVVLQLTPQAAPSTPRLIDGGVLTAISSSLSFPTASLVPALAPGVYFVRVLVDGAISPLTPFTGPPTGPLVTI